MNKQSFRFDIQSLRAVSVILVICYHFNFIYQNNPIFSGGFIGVDIFFIISGYVISNIVLIELEKNNSFKILPFIEKRLRRLIPALYFLLITLLIIGYFFLLPKRYIQLGYDTIFNTFFASNFYFWETLEKYGAITGIERPLLHTWSLSVEWQFYIFTSLIIIVFRNQILKKFNFFFISLFTVSIILNLVVLNNQINFNFYFSGSRYWEFLLGVLIRYNQLSLRNYIIERCTKQTINLLLFIFLILILIFSLSYQYLIFKKIFFLIVMIGASFIILLGNTESTFSKVLNTKFLVFTGAISYSLYVWHYPLVSFFYVTGFDILLTSFNKFLLLIPLFLISTISYYYVENIFRNFAIIKSKLFYIIYFGFTFLLIFLGIIIINNSGLSKRINISDDKKNFIINYDKNRVKPFDYKLNLDPDKKTILVLGNSHGGEFFELLNESSDITKNYNILYSLIQIECIKNFIQEKNKTNCFRKLEFKKEREFISKMKLLDKVDTIFLKTRWTDNDIVHLKDVIQFFKNKQKKVVVVSLTPSFNVTGIYEKFNPKIEYDNFIIMNSLFQKNTVLDKYYLSEGKLPIGKELIKMEKKYFNSINWKRVNDVNNRVEKISNQNQAVFLNDMNTFCNLDDKRCKVLHKDIKIHTDNSGHTTFEANSFLANKLIESTDISKILNTK